MLNLMCLAVIGVFLGVGDLLGQDNVPAARRASISPGGRPSLVVLKLTSGDVRPARGPRMRQGRRPVHERSRRRRSRPMGQGRWRLCGSPPRHKRASSLRKRNTGRKGTASRELKPVSASRAQSLYAQEQIHLGSLPLRHLYRLQVDQWAQLGPFLLDRDQ